jgi:hypothetical protein
MWVGNYILLGYYAMRSYLDTLKVTTEDNCSLLGCEVQT